MIFIDWISPKAHAAINRNLLEALCIRRAKLYVFEPALENPDHDTAVLASTEGRLARAMQVFRICWRHRRDKIFLLSYDPVLVPFLQLYCRRLYVYEHNTTPEGATYIRHALWQRLFYHRILRFAQFPGQHTVLRELGQQSVYLGSPLSEDLSDVSRHTPRLFLAPSARARMTELARVARFLDGAEVVMRQLHYSEEGPETPRSEVNIRLVTWIDFQALLPEIRAIIITIESRIRGSGWFHEAFVFGVPLIITHPDMCALFEETYPGYPYVRLDSVRSPEELETALGRAEAIDRSTYAITHNSAIRARFEFAIA